MTLMRVGALLAPLLVVCASEGAARAGPATAPAAADWPGFRGPNRNGVIDARLELAAGGPTKLWDAKVGQGNASMAVVKGRLYTVGTLPNQLVCLDARTGRPVWTRDVETYSGDSTPWVEDGRVYLLASTRRPTAYCCDAATGEILWKRELPKPTGDRQYGHAGSPLLWEDLVIFNAAGGAALKKATGEVAWLHEGFPGLATPVLFESQKRACVALFGGDTLVAREARTGKELWSVPWKTNLAVNACDPIVFDNKLFLCSDYGRGRALYDIGGGAPRKLWEFGEGKGSSFSSGFVRDGQLFCFAEGKFVSLDVGTGQPKWREDGGASVLMIGDKLVVVRDRGQVRIGTLSPAGFDALVTADAGIRDIKAVPAYWEGKLYLRNQEGNVICLQLAGSR
jgi:outer membrane protein assembly factor BamB